MEHLLIFVLLADVISC